MNNKTIFYNNLVTSDIDPQSICDDTITRIVDIKGQMFLKMDDTIWVQYYTKENFTFVDCITKFQYIVYPSIDRVLQIISDPTKTSS